MKDVRFVLTEDQLKKVSELDKDKIFTSKTNRAVNGWNLILTVTEGKQKDFSVFIKELESLGIFPEADFRFE